MDAIWKLVENDNEVLYFPLHYVPDGSSLLYCLPWTQGKTFAPVFVRYVNYDTKKYGKATVILIGITVVQILRHYI